MYGDVISCVICTSNEVEYLENKEKWNLHCDFERSFCHTIIK